MLLWGGVFFLPLPSFGGAAFGGAPSPAYVGVTRGCCFLPLLPSSTKRNEKKMIVKKNTKLNEKKQNKKNKLNTHHSIFWNSKKKPSWSKSFPSEGENGEAETGGLSGFGKMEDKTKTKAKHEKKKKKHTLKNQKETKHDTPTRRRRRTTTQKEKGGEHHSTKGRRGRGSTTPPPWIIDGLWRERDKVHWAKI